ncbi:hypothetical protein LJC57_03300 [Parabacteroides sp. OttesenSCG-928-G07]|nr:hypothetical protein [Parabacteroides sp. OttesenSCG-928-G21]MDL2277598.1 hypothetical protein [Parabacteroides sp. OttesenSCG-928-G07]
MKKLSTRCMNEFDKKQERNLGGNNSKPRVSTLEFLKQFARVYQAEPSLKKEICAYVLN